MSETPLPVLIQFAAKRTSQMLEERFQNAGLTKLHPPLGQIMGFLHSNPVSSSADIQELLRISKSTVSEALSELASRGLIEYVVNEENRREKRIVETEKGKQYQESAWKILTQFREDVLQGLGEEEQKALRESLNMIIENTKGGERG
jgi:DNA-binding MarR family transcriptional regulator